MREDTLDGGQRARRMKGRIPFPNTILHVCPNSPDSPMNTLINQSTIVVREPEWVFCPKQPEDTQGQGTFKDYVFSNDASVVEIVDV